MGARTILTTLTTLVLLMTGRGYVQIVPTPGQR